MGARGVTGIVRCGSIKAGKVHSPASKGILGLDHWLDVRLIILQRPIASVAYPLTKLVVPWTSRFHFRVFTPSKLCATAKYHKKGFVNPNWDTAGKQFKLRARYAASTSDRRFNVVGLEVYRS